MKHAPGEFQFVSSLVRLGPEQASTRLTVAIVSDGSLNSEARGADFVATLTADSADKPLLPAGADATATEKPF